MLVHGERNKMKTIRDKLVKMMGINVQFPANHEIATFECWNHEKAEISSKLANRLERNRLKRKRAEFRCNCRGFSLRSKRHKKGECFLPATGPGETQAALWEWETVNPGAVFFQQDASSGVQKFRVIDGTEFAAAGGTVRVVQWESHLCHLPVELQNPETTGIQFAFDSLDRNLNKEFKVVLQSGILGREDGVLVENTTDGSKVRVTLGKREEEEPPPPPNGKKTDDPASGETRTVDP